MHKRNLHINGYPMDKLVGSYSRLAAHIIVKPDATKTINFSDPKAVKALNAALLAHYYQIDWDIPDNYLCPPIPGRADYVHYLADLLGISNKVSSQERNIRGLDIGTGANLIYPLIATASYGWEMVGSDIDPMAISSAKQIISRNVKRQNKLSVKQQTNEQNIFAGVVQDPDRFDFCMCNPPFHTSPEQARAGSQRKISNLNKNKQKRQSHLSAQKNASELNFAGQSNELWCEGGELKFIQRMIQQSPDYAKQIDLFTSLVSKKDHLKDLYKMLDKAGAKSVETIDMAQGQKISRFIAWSF